MFFAVFHSIDIISNNLISSMAKFCKDPNNVKLIKSSKWRKVRNEYLHEHPTCERCGKLATEVHHIKPLTRFKNDLPKMEQMAFDEDNLMAVCPSCHVKLHVELGKYKYNIEHSKNYHKEQVEDFFKNYF